MNLVMPKPTTQRSYSFFEWTLALGIVAVLVAFVLPSLDSVHRARS